MPLFPLWVPPDNLILFTVLIIRKAIGAINTPVVSASEEHSEIRLSMPEAEGETSRCAQASLLTRCWQSGNLLAVRQRWDVGFLYTWRHYLVHFTCGLSPLQEISSFGVGKQNQQNANETFIKMLNLVSPLSFLDQSSYVNTNSNYYLSNCLN